MPLTPGTVTITSDFGNNAVTVIPGPVQVISIGIQGPMGPPGTGSEITGVCGADIALGIAVCLVEGLLYPADPTNVDVNGLYVGVSTEVGSTTETITVAQSGSVSTSGLTAGNRYFVGLNGILSTTPIAEDATWMRYVGTAQSTTKLILVSSVSIVLD